MPEFDFPQTTDSLLASTIASAELPGIPCTKGKVRDLYVRDDRLVLVSTDRLSAFDRSITTIPLKGCILNLLSAWWFEQTRDIVPNHILSVPHPNITVARRCTPIPIEFVVRGYLTGSTSTSLWTHYRKGVRNYCGHTLPDGLKKGDRLPQPILTPTTKDDEHDEPIAGEDAIRSGRLTREVWNAAADVALRLFAYGSRVLAKAGYVMADTKYEMGLDAQGKLSLIDEIHTPDSSRFWLAATLKDRLSKGLEPENADKEFLRLWFAERCDPYNDKELPEAPNELRLELSRRYARIYYDLTGENIESPPSNSDLQTILKEQL